MRQYLFVMKLFAKVILVGFPTVVSDKRPASVYRRFPQCVIMKMNSDSNHLELEVLHREWTVERIVPKDISGQM